MVRSSVIHQLRAWADGVDPLTGESLPSEHPAQRADTIRTLYAAVALLETDGARTAPIARAEIAGRAQQPRNAGRPWSQDDDLALVTAFDAGAAVASLAAAMERTRGAIKARLVRLGKIEAPELMRLRGSASANIATNAER